MLGCFHFKFSLLLLSLWNDLLKKIHYWKEIQNDANKYITGKRYSHPGSLDLIQDSLLTSPYLLQDYWPFHTPEWLEFSLEKSNIFKQKSDEKKWTLSTQINLFCSSQHFFVEICVNVSGSNILDVSKSLF